MEKIINLSVSEQMEINGGGVKTRVVDWAIGILLDYIIGTPDDFKEGYNDGIKRK